MRRRDLLAIAGGSVLAVTARAASAAPLDRFQWDRRLLLVFSPIRTDPRLAAQRMRMREVPDGFVERDLTVVEVVQHSVLVDGRPDSSLRAAELRALYDISKVDFATVLIGKDGGEKMRRNGLMPLDTLFETIDAMPMRRQEMRQ